MNIDIKASPEYTPARITYNIAMELLDYRPIYLINY